MLLRRTQLRDARAALHDLSRRFLAQRPSSVADPSLASGQAGLALVHASLDRVFPGAGHAAAAQRSLDLAIAGLAATALGPSLFSGFTGVAWVVELLVGDPSAAPEDDPVAGIDAALETYLSRSPWEEPYDLVNGLVGLGVYALDRMPRPSAKRLLALIVDRLAGTARRRSPGVAWWSDPEWVPPTLRQKPNPDWNLGLAHGVPGVVGILGRIAASDVAHRTRTKARALLDKAAAWLLAQELPRGEGGAGAFASAVAPGVGRAAARLAWCYGDPGVAAALLIAGRAVKKRAWVTTAARIARRAAERSPETSGVIDAGLCHGAAGVAHIFHRFFLATGDEKFAEAARAWFGRALAMRGSKGFAGFRAYDVGETGKPSWLADPGFLTGAAGVTLALVAATTETEPAWDRALLLS